MKNNKTVQILVIVLALLAALLAGFVLGRWSIPQTDVNNPAPTAQVTPDVPTDAPTIAPTDEQTKAPTDVPTDEPTKAPTDAPTDEPTKAPTDAPTDEPTKAPTDAPTDEPTKAPTNAPTDEPTKAPTDAPADEPTEAPTDAPSQEPTEVPETDATESPSVPANPMTQATEEPLPLEGVKIGIDPGHQAKGNSEKEPVAPGSSEMKAKVSSGTQGVSTRVAEYVVNLDVSLQLRDALEAQGAEVYMTRETHDINISNVERATMMNELGVDMVLRIHCNGSTDSSVRGIGLYVKKTGDAAEESYEISEYLLPAMAGATGARAMGIYQRDTYSGMNWSTVPSILVEMGFMSNPEEDKLLNDPEYQQLLVEGMVQGITDYVYRYAESEEFIGE